MLTLLHKVRRYSAVRHSLSQRLNSVVCLHAIQQISAGWADACSLHMTVLDQKTP